MTGYAGGSTDSTGKKNNDQYLHNIQSYTYLTQR